MSDIHVSVELATYGTLHDTLPEIDREIARLIALRERVTHEIDVRNVEHDSDPAINPDFGCIAKLPDGDFCEICGTR